MFCHSVINEIQLKILELRDAEEIFAFSVVSMVDELKNVI
jgi:hypothetical protein